jgi:hypothetical protein
VNIVLGRTPDTSPTVPTGLTTRPGLPSAGQRDATATPLVVGMLGALLVAMGMGAVAAGIRGRDR